MNEYFWIYQAPGDSARIQVRLEDNTLWLNPKNLTALYKSVPQNITRRIRANYVERELVEAATCQMHLQAQSGARHRARDHDRRQVHDACGLTENNATGGMRPCTDA
jgi:hypothetical protein